MSLNRSFDFSSTQLRFLAALTGLLLVISLYNLVHLYSSPTEAAIDVPTIVGDPQPLTGSFVLNPNTAPADSLELLPGIGPVLADRIVMYRQHHPFEEAIDLTNVRGIGPRLYERIKPYMKVSRP